MTDRRRWRRRPSRSTGANGGVLRLPGVQLLDDLLTGKHTFIDVMEAVTADPSIVGAMVRELQSRRRRGEITVQSAAKMIASLTELESVKLNERYGVLPSINARIEAIEREHGLAEDESFHVQEGPPEWQLLCRAWDGVVGALQARLLTSYGEESMAEHLLVPLVGRVVEPVEIQEDEDVQEPTAPDQIAMHNDTAPVSPPSVLMHVSHEPRGEPISLEIDADELCMALEDAEGDHVWYLNLQTGDLLFLTSDSEIEEEEDCREIEDDPSRWRAIEPIGSREGYRIMRDFVAALPAGAYRKRLERALEGSRPFRAFKDALGDDRGKREEWHTFHDHRMLRHAEEWLDSEEIRATWRPR